MLISSKAYLSHLSINIETNIRSLDQIIKLRMRVSYLRYLSVNKCIPLKSELLSKLFSLMLNIHLQEIL